MTYPPESEEGNIEYKLLLDLGDEEHIAGQMKRRVLEGGGEALYVIGVSNDGDPIGLPQDLLERSLAVLERAASRINAVIHVLRIVDGHSGKIAEVLVRWRRGISPPLTIYITVLGNVDAGKSTLIGAIMTGKRDNGKGELRSMVARYIHEILTGRTSSVSSRIVGFVGDKVVNQMVSDPLDEQAVFLNSEKVLFFTDLGGHERYVRTALRGVLSRPPDYVILVVGANTGLQRMGREHLGIAAALGVPVAVVVTKVDIAPPEVLDRTLYEIQRLVKMPGVSRLPMVVRDWDDVVVAARSMTSSKVVPIFLVSNVTGHGMDKLRRFLALLPPRQSWDDTGKMKLYVDEIFTVRGVGLVVGGLLISGIVRRGDAVYVGPTHDASWQKTVVRSIHVNRVPTELAKAGQYVTLALDDVKVVKGMVVTNAPEKPTRCFDAKLLVLRHPTVIRPGFEGVVHYRSIREPATVVWIDKGMLMNGDMGEATICFKRYWALTINEQFVMRNSITRVLGVITRYRHDAEGELYDPHHSPNFSDKPR